MKPIGPTEFRPIEEATATAYNERRRLSPFQLCLLCKCCSASSCATMPCCFGIDCQLPNKPFGVCAFVPKSCNCTSCATAWPLVIFLLFNQRRRMWKTNNKNRKEHPFSSLILLVCDGASGKRYGKLQTTSIFACQREAYKLSNFFFLNKVDDNQEQACYIKVIVRTTWNNWHFSNTYTIYYICICIYIAPNIYIINVWPK